MTIHIGHVKMASIENFNVLWTVYGWIYTINVLATDRKWGFWIEWTYFHPPITNWT